MCAVLEKREAHVAEMTAPAAIVAPLVRGDVPLAALTEGKRLLLLAQPKDLHPGIIFDVSVHPPKRGAFL